MKKLYLLTSIALLFASCDNNAIKQEIVQLKNQVDSLVQVNNSQASLIASMRDSITVLSYPADQRLSTINKLISDELFDKARLEISNLKKIFPNSKEASNIDQLLVKVNNLEKKKEAEIQRIKALGFKAIKPETSITIDYNKVAFSITTSNVFTFDSYGATYFYRDADRGYKYVTGTMTVTSSSKYPDIPEPQLYEIVGDKMVKSSSFDTRFARWSDYGSYLGNYHDSGNDFRKTSTIRFKVGAHIDAEIINKKPVAVVLKHENILSREENDINNPPVSYTGGYGKYPSELRLEDFTKGDYHVVKYFNF